MERHDLEQQLRDTLTARAERVQPSPDLWERVADATTRRSRWRRPATWWGLASIAAALVVGLVVVPNLLRTPIELQPIDPVPTGTDAVSVAPDVIVVRDADTDVLGVIDASGRSIDVARPEGIAADAVLDAVVVRPGVDRVEVFTRWCSDDGCTRARSVVSDGEVVTNTQLPPANQDLQVGDDGPDTTPAFDFTGRYAAWTEFDGDRHRIVVQRWEDEPTRGTELVDIDVGDGVAPSGVAGITRLEDGTLRIHTGAYEPDAGGAPAAHQFVIDVPLDNTGTPDAARATVVREDLSGPIVAAGTTPGAPGIVVALVDVDSSLQLVGLGRALYSSGAGPMEVAVGVEGFDRLVGVDRFGSLLLGLQDGRFRLVGIRPVSFDQGSFDVDLPAGTIAVRTG